MRMFWYPNGAWTRPRYELGHALRLYKLKELPERKKFEQAMSRLLEAWGQERVSSSLEKT